MTEVEKLARYHAELKTLEEEKLAAYHAELKTQEEEKLASEEERLASLTDAEFDAAYAQFGRNPNRPVRDVIGPRLADLKASPRVRRFKSTTATDRAAVDLTADPVSLDDASFDAAWRQLGSGR